VIDINYIKSESFCFGVVKISERYRKIYFSNCFDWRSSETPQWILWWMQHVLAQVHFLKVFKNKMSAELPLSTKIFPMTHPAIFTSMTMASLWFMEHLKSLHEFRLEINPTAD
jgi:hypothetical protein